MGLAFNWEPGQRGPIQRPVQCPDEQGFFPPLETFVASVSFFSLQFNTIFTIFAIFASRLRLPPRPLLERPPDAGQGTP